MRSSGSPTFAAACLARPRNGFCVTSALAPASLSWNASSSAVYVGFAGETIPPAQWQPQVTAGVSIEFGV
jgi:hypothetical protein